MQIEKQLQMNTKRLYLRTLTEVDAAVVQALFGDEFETEEAAIEHIRWINNGAYENRFVINFYIWIAETNQSIGRVYLHSKPELNGEVEIGYGISEEHRNNGYAAEASQAVVRFAFEETTHEVLTAIVKPENIASRRVIEKIGFTNCGVRILPDENGVECEFDYFRLWRNDWKLSTTLS